MSPSVAVDSEKHSAYAIERVPTSSNEHLIAGYEPVTAEAKALDKRINLKLDFIVVLVLAIDFILCGIDKTNIGYVATTSECLSHCCILFVVAKENRYGERCPYYSRRHCGLCLYTVGHLHHAAALFDGYWTPHWSEVLDRVYDGSLGISLHGSCGDEESRYTDRVEVVTRCFRGRLCANLIREFRHVLKISCQSVGAVQSWTAHAGSTHCTQTFDPVLFIHTDD